MIIWPEDLHWCPHSDQKYKPNVSQLNTNKSLESEIINSKNEGLDLLMNTSINKKDFKFPSTQSQEKIEIKSTQKKSKRKISSKFLVKNKNKSDSKKNPKSKTNTRKKSQSRKKSQTRKKSRTRKKSSKNLLPNKKKIPRKQSRRGIDTPKKKDIKKKTLQSKQQSSDFCLRNTSMERCIKKPNLNPNKSQVKRKPEPVYAITVNRQNQLIYTLMFKDSNDMSGVPIGTSEVVYQFDEMITIVQHIPGLDAIMICGSPTLYIWYVNERLMAFEYKIQMVMEPWFTIWDCLILNKKGCVILGLSTGNVIQLNFDYVTLKLEEKRIFQSNEEGLAVYSLAYFPKHDIVLAANGTNLITEFNFKFPKNLPSKNIFSNRSTRNIPKSQGQLNSLGKILSIRNISKNSIKKNPKVVNTMSFVMGDSISIKNM